MLFCYISGIIYENQIFTVVISLIYCCYYFNLFLKTITTGLSDSLPNLATVNNFFEETINNNNNYNDDIDDFFLTHNNNKNNKNNNNKSTSNIINAINNNNKSKTKTKNFFQESITSINCLPKEVIIVFIVIFLI